MPMSPRLLRPRSTARRLLDSFGGATAAFSLRRLSTAYSGPVVRVRRSSDSAEADFSEADINGGALASWVGAGNDGFATTLFDQTGNNRNMTQATAGRQPKLVSSGAVITENSLPVLEFTNARGDFLTTGNFGAALPVDAYIVARFRSFSNCAGSAVRALLSRASSTSAGLLVRENCGGIQMLNITQLAYATTAPAYSTTRRIWNFYFDSGASSLFIVNDTQVASGNAGTVAPGGFALATDLEIANRSGDVNIQEAIFYPSSQSRRADIRSTINQHYKVF